jgi:hypothetical protein
LGVAISISSQLMLAAASNVRIGLLAESDEIGPRAIETILHDVELQARLQTSQLFG